MLIQTHWLTRGGMLTLKETHPQRHVYTYSYIQTLIEAFTYRLPQTCLCTHRHTDTYYKYTLRHSCIPVLSRALSLKHDETNRLRHTSSHASTNTFTRSHILGKLTR